MNVETLNQFMLSLFFIYLLLISTNINMLLNCSIQRFLNRNLYVKHLILFVSIYLLTFILNWYTPESIVVNKEGFSLNYDFSKYFYLLQSLLYSFVIYITFVMTSKMDAFSFVVFICLLIFAFSIYLLYKVNLNELGIEKVIPSEFILTQKSIIDNIKETNESIEVNQAGIRNIVILYNMLSLTYTSLPFVIAYGVYNYWKKQKRDHTKDFDVMTFFLGVEKCKKI